MAASCSKNKLGSEVADAAVRRHPDTPTIQLARIVLKKHPHVFPSLDAAAQAIRYRRGAHGGRARQRKGVAGVAATPASRCNPLNPLRLPASDERDYPAFRFDGCKRVLVIGDMHLPYHNLAALTRALQEGRRCGVDGVFINGDLCDFHTISRFEKDPGARSFKGERDVARAFLERLRELFKKARIVFKEGNHDERLRKFVLDRAPEIYDEELFGLDHLLDLNRYGIEHVDEKREVMLGRLPVLHGHELPRGISAPVNPARGAYLRAKVSVMVSHHHRTSEHTETPLNRSIVSTWSLGCLCQLRPRYEPNNSWNHGFAIVELGPRGSYRVRNARMHEGQLLN